MIREVHRHAEAHLGGVGGGGWRGRAIKVNAVKRTQPQSSSKRKEDKIKERKKGGKKEGELMGLELSVMEKGEAREAHLRFATSWASRQLRYLPGIQARIQQFI